MSRARVCVAIPTYTCEVHVRLLESLTAAWVYCLVNGVELELRTAARFSLVQYARNYLVQEFLSDETFTHLFWLDADLGFDARAIVRLLEHDKDVVGGVYPVKSFPMWFPYEADGDERNRLHKAKMLPGGFMLCTRRAVQAVADASPRFILTHAGRDYVAPHVFDLVLSDDEEAQKALAALPVGEVKHLPKGADPARLLGEDLIFSRKLRDAGFDLWVDPDIDFRHCGMMEWGGNLARTIEAEAAEVQRGAVKIETKHLPRKVFADIDRDPAGACKRAHRAWANPYSPPPEELSRLAVLARDAETILELGSGISTLVMAAANPGAHVHAIEDDAAWADRVEAEAKYLGLPNITIHRVKLGPDLFYEIPEGLPETFGLAFVDGPAFRARPGVPCDTSGRRVFYETLADRVKGPIVIDDVEHYHDIAERFDHEIVEGRFAVCHALSTAA